MGVIGTFCQACGLPTQHDHYVPSASGPGLKIYRGSEPDGGHRWESTERPFVFGPTHEWLKAAVVVRNEGVQHGTVEDGVLTVTDGESVFVGEGADDGLTFHAACWELSGRRARRTEGTFRWSFVHAYQQQLFEVRALQDEGLGWMLEDPSQSTQSRSWREALFRDAWEHEGPPQPWVGNARYDSQRVRTSVSRWRPKLVDRLALDARWQLAVRLELTSAERADAVGQLLPWELAWHQALEGQDERLLVASEVTPGAAVLQVLSTSGSLDVGAVKTPEWATLTVREVPRAQWPARLAPSAG